jgi:3-deoxy-D-manno-octulosonate 8-phosphate phosphatase (KDO 8-P phosphatase)
MAFFKDELQHIKAMVFDVDGVFTNGRIYVSGDGYQTRSMNVKDGYSIHYAHKKGYIIGVITGGKCPSIRQRFNDLSIEDVYIASSDKMKDLESFMTKHNLSFDDILYMGDDLPDFVVMSKVRLAVCPADAAHEIKEICHYVSPFAGGDGCVRDVVEQLLKVHGNWMHKEAFVW